MPKIGAIVRKAVLILFVTSSVYATSWQEEIKNCEYHRAEELLTEEISRVSPKQKPELLLELARLFLKDQREEEAFKTFLKAIECVPLQSSTPSVEETQLFQQALHIYREETEKPIHEVTQELTTFLKPHIASHPDFATLRLLYAICRANEQGYDDFFTLYFSAYPIAHTCYLADKTRAIVHVKLYERARTVEEKAVHAKAIVYHVEQALLQEQNDANLYKLMILFCPQENKKKVISQTIEHIVTHQVMVPKKDFSFFVFQALEYKEKAAAKKFLAAVKSKYTYSRTIEELEKVLDDENSN